MQTPPPTPEPKTHATTSGQLNEVSSRLKTAVTRFKSLFGGKKDRRRVEGRPEVNGQAAKAPRRDHELNEVEPHSSKHHHTPHRCPAKTLISETEVDGLMELTVRLGTIEKRYFVDAAECPISTILDVFAGDLDFEVDEGTLTLRFDGYTLRDDSTPQDFGLENGDVIDVMHNTDLKLDLPTAVNG